jgi:hypothetical protein
LSGGGFEAALPAWLGVVSPLARGVATGLAVFLTALAVKALDDLLDEPERYGGEAGRAVGPGGPWLAVYIAAALALAVGLAPGASLSLFLMAYAVGMLPSLGERLPSGLPSWAESLAALAVALLVAGPLETLGSLLVIAGAQAFDDYRDAGEDRAAGRASLAAALGGRGALAVAILLGLGALVVAPAKALSGAAVTVALVLGWAGRKGPLQGGGERGEEGQDGRERTGMFGAAATGVVAAGLGALGALLSHGGRAIVLHTGQTPAVGKTQAAGPAFPVPWWPWFMLLLVAVVALSIGYGFATAYRRGLRRGLAEGTEAGRALARLEAAARRLEGEGMGTDA